MENASKALIIAGAILLAILIISLGIFIFSQASEITKNSGISDVEVLQFNEKFTSHEGSNVRGSEVNSLLSTIVQNNVANQEDESKKVTISMDGKTSTPTTMSEVTKALTGKTYKVECTTDSKTGFVTTVTITVNN